jgi:tetratricopeptide (TPR) repeat protein
MAHDPRRISMNTQVSQPNELHEMRARRRNRYLLAAATLLILASLPGYKWSVNRWIAHQKKVCNVAATLEDWNELEDAARAWLRWAPDDGSAWLFAAEAARGIGDFERTAACLGEIPDSAPECLQALSLRGDLLMSELHKPFEAERNWKRMLKIDESAALPQQRLIYLYAITQQRAALLAQIQKAVAAHTEPREAYTYYCLADRLLFSNGLVLTSTWLDANPGDEVLEVAKAIYSARSNSSRTLSMFRVGSAAPGDQSLIDELLEKYPHNLEVLAHHIARSINDGNMKQVESLLRQIPPEADSDSRVFRFRAWYYAARNQLTEAETACRQALQLYPLDWRVRLELTSILRRLGNTEDVEEASELALAGKELERQLLEQPNADSVDREVLISMSNYCSRVKAGVISRGMAYRGIPTN